MKDFFVTLLKGIGIALAVSLIVCFFAWYWGNWRAIIWFAVIAIICWQVWKYLTEDTWISKPTMAGGKVEEHKYREPLSHKIYAACDSILVPSRFEPCGLTQLMALKYGALPIVRETGGLKDTVEPYNEYDGTGTGFSFANYDARELLNTINYSKHVFFDDRSAWNDMVKRAMEQDYSWDKSAKLYGQLYSEL